jgi:hypothetical protein
MKQFKMFSLAIGAVMLFSCNSGNDDSKTATDSSTSTTTTTAPAPETMPDLLAVQHKVTNFTKWKQGYDSHDSARLAAGLHSYVIGRGVEDSNMLLVAARIDDTAKARQFLANPDMKMMMQKSGVTGKPTINMVHVQWMDNSTNSSTTRVMVMHKVKDWDAWKKSFDDHKQVRVDAGLADRIVATDLNDNHMVSIVFAITDMAKAKAFMASKELVEHMKNAGVESKPTVFMYNVVQQY